MTERIKAILDARKVGGGNVVGDAVKGEMMTIAEILDKAADLIEPEGAWTQHQYARGPSGRRASPLGKAAVCWCSIGAIQRVVNVESIMSAQVEKPVHAMGFGWLGTLAEWNDAPDRTQAEVVTAFRKAAILAREQGL